MYFNSLAYIFGFLPIVIIVYFALNKRKCIFAEKITEGRSCPFFGKKQKSKNENRNFSVSFYRF